MKLSHDQSKAITAITTHLLSNDEAILAGAAGTGKTTTLLSLLEKLTYNIMFFTPTGKAALRVQEQTNRTCSTIHAAFFTSVDESTSDTGGEKLRFSEPSPPEGSGQNTLWVIDESSMIGTELAQTIRSMRELAGSKILWVGDDEQLPPVEGKWGVNFSNATGRLTTVHRQAEGSNILELATMTRMGQWSRFDGWGKMPLNDAVRVAPCEVHDSVAWFHAQTSVGSNVGLITFTNKTRKLANFLYRRHTNLPQKRIAEGETLLVTMNNRGLALVNGQQVKVLKVEEYETMSRALDTLVQTVTIERNRIMRGKTIKGTQIVYCLPELFDADTKEMSDNKLLRKVVGRLYNKELLSEVREATGWDTYEVRLRAQAFRQKLVQCTWGYCLTVHKSQGSQWDHVGFISCGFFRKTLKQDVDFGKRLYYTAITRAAKQYVEMMCSFVPNVNELFDDNELTNTTATKENKMTINNLRQVFTKGGKVTVTSRASQKSHTFILSSAQGKDFLFVNYGKSNSSMYMGILTGNGFRTTKASKFEDGSAEVVALRWLHQTTYSNPNAIETQATVSF